MLIQSSVQKEGGTADISDYVQTITFRIKIVISKLRIFNKIYLTFDFPCTYFFISKINNKRRKNVLTSVYVHLSVSK